VVGVVVGVLQRAAFVSYSLDDGSAVLHCNCWFNQSELFAKAAVSVAAATAAATAASSAAVAASAASAGTVTAASATANASASALPPASLLTVHPVLRSERQTPGRAQGFTSSPLGILALGNVVRVRGKLSRYKDRRQLSVESLCQSRCAASRCSALRCTALHCAALHCTTLHDTAR
jgi:hypothetical protein